MLNLDYVKMRHSGNYNKIIHPPSSGMEYQKRRNMLSNAVIHWVLENNPCGWDSGLKHYRKK